VTPTNPRETTVCVRRPDGSATMLAGTVRHVQVVYNPGGDDRTEIVWEGAVRQSHVAAPPSADDAA
jgi:hypothetical protein